MAGELIINDAALAELLHGPDGPVMKELRKLGKTVERGAKRRSKGRVSAGVRAHEPVDAADGPYVDIETGAVDEHGAPIGLFTEVGTKPHIIEARDKQALSWPGAAHPVKRVHHPGTEAQPHLRPALHEDFQ
jgi:hypothetical protein